MPHDAERVGQAEPVNEAAPHRALQRHHPQASRQHPNAVQVLEEQADIKPESGDDVGTQLPTERRASRAELTHAEEEPADSAADSVGAGAQLASDDGGERAAKRRKSAVTAGGDSAVQKVDNE